MRAWKQSDNFLLAYLEAFDPWGHWEGGENEGGGEVR